MIERVSLWEDIEPKKDIKEVIKKVKKPKVEETKTTTQKLKSKIVTINEKLELIKKDVNDILGSQEQNIECIRSYERLVEYFDKIVENKIVAIDTETGDENGNGTLNTFDCNLMGLCLYTPGEKAAYVPVNHYSYEITCSGKDEKINLLNKLENQVTEEQIKTQLQRLIDNDVFEIYHNATFDIEVLMTSCGIKLKADWDTLVGAQLLDENELKSLKVQYKLHIDPEQEKYDIEHLFMSLPYSIFEPELFALYAGHDSRMAYDLYCRQKEQFEKPDNHDLYELFKTIEIPILDVVVNMERRGFNIDLDFANKLSKVYHKRLDDVQIEIDAELLNLKPKVDAWRLTKEANEKERLYPAKKTTMSEAKIKETYKLIDEKGNRYKIGPKSKNEKLSDPIELTSPTQMCILLYDILGLKTETMGTDAETLNDLAERGVEICKILLKKRELDILVNSFIDKIPTVLDKDGKARTRFNTCGTKTGRFSSSGNFNIQQIPSHAKDVRLIFKADSGCNICGSDFSGQENRILASLAKDEKMISAYLAGEDIYAKIGEICFKNKYEDNLEHDPITGKLNPEGKARRSKAKMINLALNYGMSAKSLSERAGISLKEAEEIVEEFYVGFSGVDRFTKESQEFLKDHGYVTDAWGRRRHIPDAQLSDFTVKPSNEYIKKYGFNPLLGTGDHRDEVIDRLIESYTNKLNKLQWKKDIDKVVAQAKKDGLTVINNKGFKNRALRQCLNARIQGSASSMTKLAMIMIENDDELNRLGFQLLATIHDEVFGQAPVENSERAGQRLTEVMVEAAKTKCGLVPWKCDPYVVGRWYLDELSAEVLKDYLKCNDLDKIKEKYSMINPIYVEQMCNETFDPSIHEDI